MSGQIIKSNRLRKVIYVVTGVVALLATYFGATGVLGGEEMALVTGLNMFVAGLAGLNTDGKN